jgi:hypothetical protein
MELSWHDESHSALLTSLALAGDRRPCAGPIIPGIEEIASDTIQTRRCRRRP